MIFLISHFSTLLSHASSVSNHGCAPLIPPSVPGAPLPVPAIPGKLLINEVLSLPGSRWNCTEQKSTFSIKSDSWVELYNPQSQPYNLYTAHAIFVIGSSTTPFYLPLGSVIAPHGYLVLFPSMFSDTLINTNIRLLMVSPTVSSPNQGPVGSGYANSTPTPILDTQTVWSSLQFPTPAVLATPVTKPTIAYHSPLSSPVDDGWDTPHRILITTVLRNLPKDSSSIFDIRFLLR
jgi:hypothetical protein